MHRLVRERLRRLLSRLTQDYRQRVLERELGQVRCSADPEMHAVGRLPCRGCGAAL